MQTIFETPEFQKNIKPNLMKGDVFQAIMQLNGKIFRSVKGRKTLQIELAGHRYFVKQHFGVGWAEIFKNLLSFRKPVLGAKTEKLAIEKLDSIGIPTTPLVAFGESGFNPATKQSFLVTRDLGNIVSLEDYCAEWLEKPPTDEFKRELIIAVAALAKKLHEAGLVHRDFYICHLCLDADLLAKGKIKLYLIDLHRVAVRQAPKGRAVMKDIAALYFSAMDIGLSAEDFDLFKQHYLQDLSASFWSEVKARADKLYKKFHSAKFQQRLKAEKSSLNR
jgi:heptose I phosphotransferase